MAKGKAALGLARLEYEMRTTMESCIVAQSLHMVGLFEPTKLPQVTFIVTLNYSISSQDSGLREELDHPTSGLERTEKTPVSCQDSGFSVGTRSCASSRRKASSGASSVVGARSA